MDETMDDSDDEICFDFRDPFNSDGDETDDENDSHTPTLEEVDSGEDEHFQRCASDCKVYPMTGKASASTVTYSYVQAVDLERSLQAGMSLLESHPREGGTSREHEGTCSEPGSSSTMSDPHDFHALEDDLRQVVSRLIDEKGRAEVFLPGAATSELPLVQQGQEYPEKLDRTREKLPIRKRIVIKWSGRQETAEIEWTPAEPHKKLLTAAPDVKLKDHLIVDPVISEETADPVAESGISQQETVGRVVEYVEKESAAKSDIQRVTGHVDEMGMSLNAATPFVKAEELQEEIFDSEQEEETSTITHPYTVIEPPDGRYSIGEFPKLFSRWQRLQARLWQSEQNQGSRVCSRCGIQQYVKSEDYVCNICFDERRNFPVLDPLWVPHRELKILNLRNDIFPLERDLSFQISTSPTCFQGNRAFLLKLPDGNILWDCLTYIDEDTVLEIATKGGLKIIAISGPERIGASARMSYIFNRCLIYLHRRGYLTKEAGKSVRKFWADPTEYLGDGVTLIHLGGHFQGSCILHLDHKGGIVFSSNTLKVGADKKSVSVMLHFDNYLPASPRDVRRILHIMECLEFDELWGDKPGEQILEQAKPRVISSLRRYIKWAQHDEDDIDFGGRPLTKRELIARGKRKVREV